MSTEHEHEVVALLRRSLHRRAEELRPSALQSRTPQRPASAPLRFPGPRWAPAVAGVSLIAAALVVALLLPGAGHPVRVTGHGVAGAAPGTGVPTAPVTPPPATAGSPTTLPSTAPSPPPAAALSQPLSATFVSASTGWAAGRATSCPAFDSSVPTKGCLALVRTDDAGHTWRVVPAPLVPVGPEDVSQGAVEIRFADARNGWVYESQPGNRLWETHDGGTTWSNPLPAPGGTSAQILDLEISAGRAYLATVSGGAVTLYSSPVSADRWTAVWSGPLGAGPVPAAQIVLHGTSGWLLDEDRTVLAGARLVAGVWRDWTPPCRQGNGPAFLAAASTTSLTAICEEGEWGTPDPGTQAGRPYVFRSADGGSTFSLVGPLPTQATNAGGAVTSLAVAPGDGSTLLAGSENAIWASSDGGSQWSSVYLAPGGTVDLIGYTTALQAEAIIFGGNGSEMVVSRDGGRSWTWPWH